VQVAVEAEGLEGGAVVAGHQRDHAVTLSLSGRDRVGAQELQCHLYSFGATGREVRSLEPGAGERGESLGERCVCVMAGGARIGVGGRLALLQHCPKHALIALAERGEERARTGVEKAPAAIVDEVDAVPRDDRRQSACDRTVEEHVLCPAHRRKAPVRHRPIPLDRRKQCIDHSAPQLTSGTRGHARPRYGRSLLVSTAASAQRLCAAPAHHVAPPQYRLWTMIIRDADPQRDAAACAAIYAPYVADSAASFEERPPTAAEMSVRISAAHAWVLAEHDGLTLGYAYGSRHRDRAAYRWVADVAVYIDAGHQRSGVGRALYTQLFEQLRTIGLWALCAGITQPNDASNGLHRAMGFVPVGTYSRIGWKAGAWHDVEWLQLDLRPGESGAPDELDGAV
jgi:phosphinothricin acetyltransferase